MSISKRSTIQNTLVEELTQFHFKLRTNWVKDADGNLRGDGYTQINDKTNPLQRCDNTAFGNCVAENTETFKKLSKIGARLINGEVRSKRGDWDMLDNARGCPIYHCWVEVGDKVYDYSQGSKTVADKDLFYMVNRVKRVIDVTPQVMRDPEGNVFTFSPAETEDRRTRFYNSIRAKKDALLAERDAAIAAEKKAISAAKKKAKKGKK